MENIQSVAVYVLGLILALLIARIMSKPLKFMLRIVFNTLIGGVILILINTIGAEWGILMGVNPVTAAITGILGVPGIILLFVLKYIFCG